MVVYGASATPLDCHLLARLTLCYDFTMDDGRADVSENLARARDLLIAIVGRILQTSNRRASVAMGAATNALTGTAFMGAVTGAVGSLGTAGTGAAIAGLSGAAKTTATLYWIGGLVGGGVAAGTAILGVSAIGVGVYGSIRVRRTILGHARREADLSDDELRILEATNALVSSIEAVLAKKMIVSREEVPLFFRVGVSPLLAEIDLALSRGRFDDLKTYSRMRLRGHVTNLRTLQRRMEV